MTWTRGLLGRIRYPFSYITRITCKEDLSQTINEWREILATAEVNALNITLRICMIQPRRKSITFIKLFLVEGQEPIEIYHRLRIHDQDDAVKKSTFDGWVAEICAARTDLSNHNSNGPVAHLTFNIMT